MGAKKRERLEVISDILSTVQKSRSIGPTRLLRQSNLSTQMFNEYMDELLTKDFIHVQDIGSGRKKFQLTDKGHMFLEKYQVILGFVQDFGL